MRIAILTLGIRAIVTFGNIKCGWECPSETGGLFEAMIALSIIACVIQDGIEIYKKLTA